MLQPVLPKLRENCPVLRTASARLALLSLLSLTGCGLFETKPSESLNNSGPMAPPPICLVEPDDLPVISTYDDVPGLVAYAADQALSRLHCKFALEAQYATRNNQVREP